MSRAAKRFYEFGPFRLDPAGRILRRGDDPVRLKPKVFDLLMLLVESRGHALSKEEIFNRLWPNSFVEDSNLAVSIFALRKALGDDRNGHAYIQTVPRYGYRFTEAVRELPEPFDPQNGETEHATLSSQRNEVRQPVQEIFETSPNNINESANSTNRRRIIIVALVVITVLVSVGLVSKKFYMQQHLTFAPFQQVRLARITNTGSVREASISPDGKYIAYVLGAVGRQSVWVRQLSTASDIQIIAPSESEHWGLTFSQDGSHVYYLKWSENATYTLSQVPVLGGLPKEVIANVDSPVSFSPDGKLLAFVRRSRGTRLMIARSDGSEERTLATRSAPDFFTNGGPTWSPDGEKIACVTGSVKAGRVLNVVAFRVADGAENVIPAKGLNPVGRIAWLADGSGLVVTAADPVQSSDIPRQIWMISYPHGQPRRISNDANDYSEVSISADSRTLVTVQKDLFSSVWLQRTDQPSVSAQQISLGQYDGFFGVSWTPDGGVVYSSHVGSERDIWIKRADGGNKQRLTDTHQETFPTVTPDGGSIVFVSSRTGTTHIWRMDISGNNQRQLTNGLGETLPQCSPDGKFIVYVGINEGKRAILRIPIDGGHPKLLTTLCSLMPAISPDGKKVACYYLVESSKREWHIAVVPFEGGEPSYTFDMPPAIDPHHIVMPLRWSPDGRSLTYIDNRGGASNIWSLPLNGSSPKKLTEFDEHQIFGYEWSRDGKHLVFSRGIEVSDVTIITDIGH